MLYESKKQSSQNSWHRFQHLSYVRVTTSKVWMDHHHDLSTYNKRPDALTRYLPDLITPVVSSQGSMVKNPVSVIAQKNQSIFMAPKQGSALHPNGILTHSYPTSFLICNSLIYLP